MVAFSIAIFKIGQAVKAGTAFERNENGNVLFLPNAAPASKSEPFT